MLRSDTRHAAVYEGGGLLGLQEQILLKGLSVARIIQGDLQDTDQDSEAPIEEDNQSRKPKNKIRVGTSVLK